ncbi:DNA cytosine methyltransferase [Azospirillum sp. TSA6c]|uniref:DNA cytosine methyltransferase n=1 Tax=Azospirillum sp. TSA6c TaxID=709813 RepID=UPI0018EE80E7|nr:DNA cytosine methyltransferase [Azospirillum sp. TSA6c]
MGGDQSRIRRFPGIAHEFIEVAGRPLPTLTTRPFRIVIERDGKEEPMRPPDGKPPYRVPSMAEVAALPWNGFSVASTFSGCGGSSLGYRMAGFRVLWASEFIEAARNTYRANASPYTIVDPRDIRQVKASDILDAIGMKPGELDLFDGSPPCASFSTSGKREAGWGRVKKYSDTEQRTDDLFFEYARLIQGLRPKTFVAENVSGLVKGTAKGYFLEILQTLKRGYRVEAKLLDAQWLGVPQARQRLIFVGVREDLCFSPAFPKPLPFRYTVRDAIPWICGIGGIRESGFSGERMVSSNSPCPTIMAGGGNGMNTSQFGVEAETDISRFAIGEEWDKLKPGEQSDRFFQLVKPPLDGPCPTITASGGSGSIAGVVHPTEKRKFTIPELRRICGFPDDFVLTGTYQQQWERLGRAVPPVMMMHIAGAVRDGVLRRLPRGA